MKPSLPLASAFTASRMVDGGLDARAVDATVLDGMKWMAEYATAGYCNAEGIAGTAVSCNEGACPGIVSNGATIVTPLDGWWESSGGVIIRDDVNQDIVVSFSGTNTFGDGVLNGIADWLLNLNFILDDIDLCDGCKIHSGFHDGWLAMANTVINTLQNQTAEYPGYSISFTGHSLGASIATVGCAYWRANHNGTCELYTFGSPRVGNTEFAEFVSAQAGNEYRVTHLDDPVPRLPPHDFGYDHTDTEYWLSTGTSTTTDYNESDVVICKGTYNRSCNGAGLISLNFDAHVYYFTQISICASASA